MGKMWNQVYWGNTVLLYLLTAAGIIIAWLILKIIKGRIIGLLKTIASRTHTNFDDLLVKATEKFILPLVYLFINYHIIRQLNLSERTENVLGVAMLVVSTFFVIRLINFSLHGAVVVYMEQKNEPAERIKQLSGILLVIKAIVWSLGFILLLDNMGYDVTTIIAGLGVGGIAIALAAQNILGDLFSYLVIFFDKPFEVGDFIVAGNDSGVVEKIGIKTTHVRSLTGEQLVMPNSEMVKDVIHNFKRLERRRIVFSLGVVYYTSAGRLKGIPSLLKNIISTKDKATFDRAHLQSFGDFSINFEIVYYLESADYVDYMDTHHAICLDIFEVFEREGIEFAFPTQTIFMSKQGKEEARILN
ncbi:MAG: mechanosensitive ion channel family protein [Chitinophagaceae bacterium]|nr:mechanosensitive ion channel family protein [Chitinophagaceae bacterium]